MREKNASSILSAAAAVVLLIGCSVPTVTPLEVEEPEAPQTYATVGPGGGSDTGPVAGHTDGTCSGDYCFGRVYYTGTVVNLRAGPGGDIIGRLGCGDSVTVTGEFQTQSYQGQDYVWAQVQSSTGQEGWVAIQYFDSTGAAVPCSSTGDRNASDGFIATTGDDFSDSAQNGIDTAGDNIANALAEALGGSYTADTAWNAVFGDTAVTFQDTGMNCHDIGVNYFNDSGFDSGCWAASGPGGNVYVSTEFTGGTHTESSVTNWASHETGHEVDILMTSEYAHEGYTYYGDYVIANFSGGIDGANSAIPDEYQSSASSDRDLGYEVFADAFECWSNPSCQFTDPDFEEYFDDVMTQYAQDQAGQ